jgi:hypothetical protein
MGWGSGIGLVFLTTVMGGLTALGLAYFLVWFIPVSNFEGGSGYFTLFVILSGIAGGFVVGLITALSMSVFDAALLRAAEIVLALTVVVAIIVLLAKAFEDKGPKLEGDSIRLEVELRCPRDWKPDNALKAGHGGCWIQKYPKNGTLAENPIVSGSLTWDHAPAPGDPWAISCVVPLEKTASPRYMLVYTSQSIEVTFQVPLPRHPGPKFKQWSEWSSEGFLPQEGRPVPPGDLAFRFRVLKDSEYTAAHPSAEGVYKKAREKALVAMPPSPTVADWLPFYENIWLVPTYHNDILGPEVEEVNAHPEDLLPLLRSDDMAVARRAAWATTFLKSVPTSLIEPLAQTGLQTIQLIRAARAGSLPNDPDEFTEEKASSFYTQWKLAMEHAGSLAAGRSTMEQIAAELKAGPLDEKLNFLAAAVKKNLEEISQAK